MAARVLECAAMDPKKPYSLDAPGAREDAVVLPRVDERLAPPETRVEYLHGIEMFAAPALPPHATRHADVAMVLRAAVAPGYTAAVDMLTRTGEASDFAPDASIYPSDPDKYGHRQLEELAFEITDEQALSVPTNKARELIRRGVRRVFCILVKSSRVLEWSRETDGWQPLLLDSFIEDRCLVVPLKVRALVEAAVADEAVGKALLAKGNTVIAAAQESAHRAGTIAGRKEGELAGRKEGELAGRREALFALLEARGLAVDAAARERIARERDPATLERWVVRAASAPSMVHIFE